VLSERCGFNKQTRREAAVGRTLEYVATTGQKLRKRHKTGAYVMKKKKKEDEEVEEKEEEEEN